MVGEWKPVQSNDILKALFNEKYGLKKDMTKALLGAGDSVPRGHSEKVCVSIFKGETEAYITTSPSGPIEIEGILKSYDGLILISLLKT